MLAIFEKFRVIESIDDWQIARTARNLAAHDYETDYDVVAEHFNTLHALRTGLYRTARRLIDYCTSQLAVAPQSADFSAEFHAITAE